MDKSSVSTLKLEGDGLSHDSQSSSTSIEGPRERSLEADTRIKVKNRRMRYLNTHPEYFSSSLELADPLAYDRFIRRFQTSTEREEEGRRKGYSGVLEADLWRSEAKMEALSNPSNTLLMTYRRGQDGEILAEEKDEVPTNKEDGLCRWRKEMELRFLRGDDEDFEYRQVDESEEFDDRGVEEREQEEKWFEEEEPRWVVNNGDEEVKREVIQGETGIQDF